MLGGHCNFSSGSLTRVYALPQNHSGIHLRATVHLIDRWQGESAVLKVDGQTVWSLSHHHCPGALSALCGISVAGDDGIGDTLGVAVDLYLPHAAASATVEFDTSLASDPCTASLAVDDVEFGIY